MIKVKRRTLGIMLILFLTACHSNEFDAESHAKEYCKCLAIENRHGDFFDAMIKCDSKLLMKNKFYRAFFNETYQGRYMFLLSQGMRDSTSKFISQFRRYIEKNCCKIAIEGCDSNDIFQLRRRLLDTLTSF